MTSQPRKARVSVVALMEKPEQQEHHGGTGNEAGAAMQAATYHVAYSTIKEKNRSF